MDEKRMPTCGDCIHADVCERNPLYTEFSRDNLAYCEGFKNKANYTEVVRCKDCKYYNKLEKGCDWHGYYYYVRVEPEDFCSYGERKTESADMRGNENG